MEKIEEDTIYEDERGRLYYVEGISTEKTTKKKYVIYKEVYNLERKLYGDVEAKLLELFDMKKYEENDEK